MLDGAARAGDLLAGSEVVGMAALGGQADQARDPGPAHGKHGRALERAEKRGGRCAAGYRSSRWTGPSGIAGWSR